MERVVVFRHRSGSRAEAVDAFPLTGFLEALIGRNPAAAVRFDPERDDVVGRDHARVVCDGLDPLRFSIVDLDSRNGTYVNKQRVAGARPLAPGDVIQLGPGGPEVEFDLDEVPEAVTVHTGVVPAEPVIVEGAAGQKAPPGVVISGSPAAAGGEPAGVAREARTAARWHDAALWTAIVFVWIVMAAALGLRLMRVGRQAALPAGAAPARTSHVPAGVPEAVGFVEVQWALEEAGTHRPVFHEYYVERDVEGRPATVGGQPIPPVPVYVQLADGHIGPSLTVEAGEFRQNRPVGGRFTASGCVLGSGGLIVTSGDAGAPWTVPYRAFPPVAGLVFRPDSATAQRLEWPPADWVPGGGRLASASGTEVAAVAGRIEAIEVTLGTPRRPVPARLVRTSEAGDLALLDAGAAQPLKTLGAAPVPAGTPGTTRLTILGCPNPSLTTAAAAWPRAGESPGIGGGPTAGGDADQGVLPLSTAAAPSFDGGPVLDAAGRLVGVFRASRGGRPARVIPAARAIALLPAAGVR